MCLVIETKDLKKSFQEYRMSVMAQFLFCFQPAGMAVYNVVIACVVGTPVVTFVQDKEFEATFIVTAICILFSTTTTLCIVFVPKVRI